MKTRVIPAQITTVEDKIVGNLNLLQLLLLTTPVLWLTLVYVFFPPVMKLAAYKLILCSVTSLASVGLSLRIKGKVVLNWLGVLAKYNLRPKYYVYDKNDTAQRDPALPPLPKSPVKSVAAPAQAGRAGKPPRTKFKLRNLVAFEELLRTGQVDLRYKPGKKGGLHVAFQQVDK